MSAITNHSPSTNQAKPVSQSVTGFLANQFALFLDTLFDWHDRVQARHHLLEMDDHMLRDIGITSADVHRETSKKFWQA